ncbi:MAG TPA: peptidylprolyl isomerase [Bacteroidales bacterium]|nr:peptidylprolyl isomerase [Bacteroidales bacterium]
MATLQKIRNKAGLLALIIGLALFAFIIGDFLNSGSSLFRQSQQKIAKIGDYSLDYKDYEARIAEMEQVYKIQTGQNTLDDAISGQIRESVYESIVREQLLDQQASELGITVTGKEIFSMINGANVHPMIQQLPIFKNPQTGQFDHNMMLNFLQTIQTDDLSAYPQEARDQIKSLKVYWMFWENNLKYTRLEEKINTLLTKAVQANSLDAKASYADRADNLDFAYVCEPYSALPDSLYKASKNEVKKRYNSQIERFRQKPYRSAKYIVVDVKASQEDFKVVEDKVKEIAPEFTTTTDYAGFVNENSDSQFLDCYVSNKLFTGAVKDFVNTSGVGAMLAPVYSEGAFVMAKILDKSVAPDSVKARQIVLSTTEQTRVDSLMAALKAGADFNQLAQKFSRNNGGADMGWFREVDALSLGTSFIRSCFSASVNSYFTVKTKNSINIVQVTQKTAPVAKTKLALVTLKVTPSSQTYSNVYNKVNTLVAKYTEAGSFFTEAQKAGYEVRDLQSVRSSDNTIADLPQMRQAVRFVYNNDAGKVSGILENQNNQFVVIGVTAVNDGDYQPVEAVEQLLLRELIDENKASAIIKDIQSKKAASLPQLAQALKVNVDSAQFVNFSSRRITGLGEEPALVAAVTSAPLNQLSAPVQGKNGVYVFQVVSNKKTQEVFNLQQEKATLNSMNMYRLMYQSYEAVKNATKIKDSRIKFY